MTTTEGITPAPAEPASSGRLLPQTGDEYLESLRDGREVWIYGERVKDVTTHPAFRNGARSMARLYDAFHKPETASTMLRPTDTGSGGQTHPFFKVARSKQDLRDSVAAIQTWQDIGFGWIGRSPDYKAAMLTSLGAIPEWYGEYESNARFWYKESQEKVLHMAHAIANPPVDRGLPVEDTRDVFVHVERETDAGLIISGAKVVATGSPLTQNIFVTHFMAPVQDKAFALTFIAPSAGKGIKYLARASYEQAAATASSPFDYPLSSRLDENDAILIFDNALIPWENVLVYDVAKVQEFGEATRWTPRAVLQSSVRFTTKLEFVIGLIQKALNITGSRDPKAVQAQLGELIAARNMLVGLRDGMIEGAEPGPGGAIEPNQMYTRAYAAHAPGIYRRMREVAQTVVSSGLIYLNSHAVDFSNPEIRPLMDRFMRGSNGTTALDRSRIMKTLWDAVGSEFGGRHDLYELNYFGQPQAHHLASFGGAMTDGTMARMEGLVDRFHEDYDLDGWTAPDLIRADDVRTIAK